MNINIEIVQQVRQETAEAKLPKQEQHKDSKEESETLDSITRLHRANSLIKPLLNLDLTISARRVYDPLSKEATVLKLGEYSHWLCVSENKDHQLSGSILKTDMSMKPVKLSGFMPEAESRSQLYTMIQQNGEYMTLNIKPEVPFTL